MPSADSFAKDVDAAYTSVVNDIATLAEDCHVLGLQEVHAHHHGAIDAMLSASMHAAAHGNLIVRCRYFFFVLVAWWCGGVL